MKGTKEYVQNCQLKVLAPLKRNGQNKSPDEALDKPESFPVFLEPEKQSYHKYLVTVLLFKEHSEEEGEGVKL